MEVVPTGSGFRVAVAMTGVAEFGSKEAAFRLIVISAALKYA